MRAVRDLPSECRVCDGDGPEDVNALDRFVRDALRRPEPRPARIASHLVAGFAPAVVLSLATVAAAADRRADEAPVNALLVVEATASAVLVTEALKWVALRERPRVHALDEDARRARVQDDMAVVSLPSLHASSVFALAAAGGAVATMRGYRLAPTVWIAGGMLGLTAGYLRIAADEHYFTDVLAGAGVGVGVGLAVPLLFHRPERAPGVARLLGGAIVTSRAVPGGRVVSLGWPL